MKNLFEIPENSLEYWRVSMFRTGIIFFLLYGYLHVTQMWPGFEDTILLVTGLSIVYHYVNYFKKRRAERKAETAQTKVEESS